MTGEEEPQPELDADAITKAAVKDIGDFFHEHRDCRGIVSRYKGFFCYCGGELTVQQLREKYNADQLNFTLEHGEVKR